MVFLIGPKNAREAFAATLPDRPQIHAELRPLQTGMDWTGQRVLAFAGIGRPEKFFATLRSLGADLAGTVALDDHQPLDERLLRRLTAQAQTLGAELVTTEKDAMRLPQALQGQVLTLPVRLQVMNEEPLTEAIARLHAKQTDQALGR